MQSPLRFRTAVTCVREKLPLLYFKALYWQMHSSPQTRCMKRQTIFILNEMQYNVAKYYMLSTNIQYTDFNGDGKKKPQHHSLHTTYRVFSDCELGKCLPSLRANHPFLNNLKFNTQGMMDIICQYTESTLCSTQYYIPVIKLKY